MRATARQGWRSTALLRPARQWYRGFLRALATGRNRLPGACRITARGENNTFACRDAQQLRRVRVIVNGSDNTVEFDSSARLDGCRFVLNGNGNRVSIGASHARGLGVILSGSSNRIIVEDECMLLSLGLVCEDSENKISIGAGTQVHGSTELATIEGTGISVGAGCLFSGGVHFRTGDSHSLVDLEGRRINKSMSISIGDHVWVGRNATVLKGVSIAHSSVIGASSVVTKRFEVPHCVIAGNPAAVTRKGIDWKFERIPVA